MNLGYEPVRCATEDEARARVGELKAQHKYPVYFFKSDTTGEKDFEEFYTENETIVMDKFDSLGVIKNEINYGILQYDLNGNFIKKYDTCKQAMEELNIKSKNYGNIGRAVRGKRKTAYGYIWKQC